MNELAVSIRLGPEQLQAIAEHVAAILADASRPENLPEFLTVARAAELAGVSPKTVANWLSVGRLTRHGIGRRPLVSRDELLALLRAPTPRLPRRGVRASAPYPRGSEFSQRARQR